MAFPTATEEGDVFQAGGVMAGGSVRDVRQTMLWWKVSFFKGNKWNTGI